MPNPFDQFDASTSGPMVAPAAQSSNPFDQFDPVVTTTRSVPAPKGSGITANAAAGGYDVAKDLSGMLTDAVMNPQAIADRAWNMAGAIFGQKPTPRGTPTIGDVAQIAAKAVNPGWDTSKVIAATPGERIARAVGGGVVGGIAPMGEAMTVGRMIANGLIGGAAGTGSGVAQEVAPDALKPAAGIVGGLLAGGGVAGAEAGVRAAGRVASDTAAPFVAAVSPEAARAQAGATLVNRATDPAAVQAGVNPGAGELVPGSKPTTFQQTGDMGLGALEREQATKNPVPFMQRAAEQNEAQRGALQDIQSGADPNALASGIKANFDQLDADTQGHLDALLAEQNANVQRIAEGGQSNLVAAQEGATKAATAIGGLNPPEVSGESLRAAINEAVDAEKVRMKGLYDAVDPNADLVGNAQHLRQAATDIPAAMSQAARPMEGEESAIFQAARDLPPLSSLQDIEAIRSRVSAEMRRQQQPTGDAQSLRRLTMLRQAIQENLSTTIAQKVANEAGAIDRGQLDASDSTAARLQTWADEWKQQREAQARVGGGTGTSPTTLGGSTGSIASDGAGLPSAGGSVGAPSDQGLPPNAPTIDDAALARLNLATSEYAKYKGRFGQPAVASTIARAGGHELFRLPDGRVPGKFFHPGPTGYSDMQALFGTAGIGKALPIITDYAAASLRKAAMNPDGTLDPAKFVRWRNAHADALRALPQDVRQRFGAAADASAAASKVANVVSAADKEAASIAAQTITAAAAARALTLKGFQSGAIGKVMGLSSPEDVTRVVGSILRGKTAVSEMKLLAKAAQDAGPDAVAGLRQAVADHIANNYIGNTEAATSGVTKVKADAFQTFMRQNRAAIGQVFTDNEVSIMEAVARDIQRAKRSENAVKLPGQSNTAQDLLAVNKNSKGVARAGRTMIDGLAGAVGAAFHGPIGALIGVVGAHAIQAMREAGISRVDELVTQALLHPEIARDLMKNAPTAAAPGTSMSLARSIRTAAIATGAAATVNQGKR